MGFSAEQGCGLSQRRTNTFDWMKLGWSVFHKQCFSAVLGFWVSSCIWITRRSRAANQYLQSSGKLVIFCKWKILKGRELGEMALDDKAGDQKTGNRD